MKFKYNTLLSLPLFAVLILSLSFNSSSIVAQTGNSFADTFTGDQFSFDLYGDRTFSSTRDSSIWNASNPLDIWRDESVIRNENINYNGWMDIFFVNDANVSGDRWVVMERETQNLFGSEAFESHLVFDKNGDENRDDNFTRDLSDERRFENDLSEVFSNATYMVLFEEFFEAGTYVDFEPIIYNENSTFDGFVPLVAMNVSVQTQSFFIGALSLTLPIRTVEMTFSLTWTENTTQSFPWGPEDDSSTPWVEYNVTQSLSYDQTLQYYYDNNTGVLLGSWSSSSGTVDVDMSAKGVDVLPPTILEASQFIHLTFSSVDGFDLVETNAWYENTRPSSTGTNRLMAGDVLTYGLETEGHFDSFFDISIDNGAMVRNENGAFDSLGEGTAEMRIWRHDPGFVEAVLIFNQEATGTETRNFHDSDPNNPDQNSVDSFFDVSFDIDFFSAPSTDQHELAAELDAMKHIDLGDEDNNDDCRDDCDQGIFIPGPREMLLMNSSTEIFIPEEEADGSPIITINGFDWIPEVEGLRGSYSSSFSGQIEIRLGDGPDALVVMADVTVEAEAEQGFFWDTQTGALLAIEESSQVWVTINFNGQVPNNDPENPGMINVDIKAETHIENSFMMLLETHPHLYQEAQTDFPVRPTPTTSSVPTTTSTEPTTTTSDEPTSSEDGNGADLPLPVPIVPTLSALALVAIYVRKRKI